MVIERAELIRLIAIELSITHFDGMGCGTHGTSGCSRCHGPSPATAAEVAEEVVTLIERLERGRST